MRNACRPILALALLGAIGPAAGAHYNMLLPQEASVRRGREVTIVYQWGHPFEHQLFNAPAPQSLLVITPDGKKQDLAPGLEKIQVPGVEGKKVVAYRLRYTPRQFGDYLLVLNTPPIWMADEKVFFQDTVKVVLHVATQEGWDRGAGQPFELLPLTRPYGLEPGMAFQAQVTGRGQPVRGTLVEVERYNPAAPKKLPPDEQVTRTVRTDPNGVATCTLTDPGWWCLTARQTAGAWKREGKEYPLTRRTTLWVFVDEKAAPK